MLFRSYSPIWKFAWSYQDEVRYAKKVERGLNAWDTAVGAQSAAPLRPIADGEFRYVVDIDPVLDKNIFADFRYVLSPMAARFFPAMKRAFATQTLRELAIAAIALKRYELREGKSATTLDQLVPGFLKQLPHDFMDGKILRYKLTADGPLLYSVGNDGKDDGGDTSAAVLRNFTILDGKDFVWPQEASPEEVKARFGTGD